MDKFLLQKLLQDLKNPDESVRERATTELWQIWFEQKGELGLEILRRAETYLEAGEISQAETLLSETIQRQPDFAEAWNRRAVLYYTQGEYTKARHDCLEALQLNPHHFGAWHGLGLCHATLGDYQAAIQAFRKALEIQPHALINQKLILECTARLS